MGCRNLPFQQLVHTGGHLMTEGGMGRKPDTAVTHPPPSGHRQTLSGTPCGSVSHAMSPHHSPPHGTISRPPTTTSPFPPQRQRRATRGMANK
ncbi:MAG: hypothetical protein ACI3Y5_01905 [Prevotella sp.]